MTTPVVFRKFIDGGDLIALFPTLPGTMAAHTCDSYQRLGQHSAASVELFYEDTLPAHEAEYMPLLRELERIGYDDLRIYRRYQQSFTAERLNALNASRQTA